MATFQEMDFVIFLFSPVFRNSLEMIFYIKKKECLGRTMYRRFTVLQAPFPLLAIFSRGKGGIPPRIDKWLFDTSRARGPSFPREACLKLVRGLEAWYKVYCCKFARQPPGKVWVFVSERLFNLGCSRIVRALTG